MSSQESQNLPQKSEVKQRPPVPIKPSNNTSDTLSVEGAASQNSGNVKKIANKFSQPEAKIPSGDTAKSTSRQQRPPAIKPRRKLKSFPPTSDGKAPPLPPKSRQNHSGQKDGVDSQERQEGALSAVDGSRSGMVHLLSFQDLFGLLPGKSPEFFPPTIFSHQI